MQLKKVIKRNSPQNKELAEAYENFDRLIKVLSARELPEEIGKTINRSVLAINAFNGPDKDLITHIESAKQQILELLEKELKLVTQNRYRKLGMILGVMFFAGCSGPWFGIPLSKGIPLGMLVGVIIGVILDRKAKEKGRQLEFEG